MEGKKVAVIGSGSWATAIVKMLCETQNEVHWWIRNEDSLEHIQKYGHNPKYLPSAALPVQKLRLSSNLEETLKVADIIFIAVPSAFVYDTFHDKGFDFMQGKTIVSAIKGMVAQYHSIPGRFFHKEFGTPYEQIGIISGPCHAEEVAMEKLSYVTIAFQNQELAQEIANMISCRFIKVSISDDTFGTELSAVLKNIYAIASGIYHGLGYGDNFQAVLASNAIQEIENFIDVVNPIHRDVKSSAYLGDLLVTAYSQFSRNRTFGNMIGKGYSVKAAQLEMSMVAEGYYAARSIFEMNKKFNVDMPISTAVYNILYERISPVIEMRILADKLA